MNAAAIHYEPMGIYPGSKTTLDELAEGGHHRHPERRLQRDPRPADLQDLGYITLTEGINASSVATVLDIVDNPMNLEILEMNAENIPHSLPDVAFGIINGNYALQAGLTGNDASPARTPRATPPRPTPTSSPAAAATRTARRSRPSLPP